MKRIVSVLIAVLLLSSCFLSLPVLADGTETSGEPVEVANIDFAKKYQDLNLTQPTDANGLENLGIGVADKTSVKYQKAKSRSDGGRTDLLLGQLPRTRREPWNIPGGENRLHGGSSHEVRCFRRQLLPLFRLCK